MRGVPDEKRTGYLNRGASDEELGESMSGLVQDSSGRTMTEAEGHEAIRKTIERMGRFILASAVQPEIRGAILLRPAYALRALRDDAGCCK